MGILDENRPKLGGLAPVKSSALLAEYEKMEESVKHLLAAILEMEMDNGKDYKLEGYAALDFEVVSKRSKPMWSHMKKLAGIRLGVDG